MTYSLNWSDASKAPVEVFDDTLDTTSTSLSLIGKNLLDYGKPLQENLLRLAENFASGSAPANPTVGQLWFNLTDKRFYVCVDSSTQTWDKLTTFMPFFIDPVRATSITTMTPVGLATQVDGVTLAEGDRVLLKDQLNPTENGIWLANLGAWTQLPAGDLKPGSIVFTVEGGTNGSSGWLQLSPTPGSTGATFASVGGTTGSSVVSGGNGISISGSTISINPSVVVTSGSSPTLANATLTGDLDVDGGDIRSVATSFGLLNTTTTAIHFGGAATTISIGAPTGATTVSHNLLVTSNTASTSSSTGSLVVTGGVGVGGKLSVNQGISAGNGTSSTDFSSGAIVVNGGVGVSENISVGGVLQVQNAAPVVSLIEQGQPMATGQWRLRLDNGSLTIQRNTHVTSPYLTTATALAFDASTLAAIFAGDLVSTSSVVNGVGTTATLFSTPTVLNVGNTTSTTDVKGSLSVRGTSTLYGAATLIGGVEVGTPGSASTVRVDFRSGGLAPDYDSRIEATGGTGTDGQGSINLIGASIKINGSDVAFLNSPTFTGTPTAPTPTASDISTKLATTEFVNTKLLAFTGFKHMVTLTTSGTWTVPANVTSIKVTVIGGGGGGGSPPDGTTINNSGQGGSGGGCAIKYLTNLVPGATISYLIGAGGLKGPTAGSNGTAGGTTSFGAYCSATGGQGGFGQVTNASNNGTWGIGGVGSNGDLNLHGSQGSRLSSSGTSILGGSVAFGVVNDVVGQDASVPGAGGGGGWLYYITSTNHSARLGGNGAPGIIIIEY